MTSFTTQIALEVREMVLESTIRANHLSSGKVFWVMNTSDDQFEEISREFGQKGQVYTTAAGALAAVTSNRNDIIFLNGHGSHSNAMMTVSVNRLHWIGLDGGGRLNSQGAKLVTPATSIAASTAVVKNTGTRNTYRNIKFVQNGTNSAQVSGVEDTGEGTYMQFCEMEVNSILSTVTQGLLFKGDTCHYDNCQIGNSTVYHTAGDQAPLVIKTPARYSYFTNCTIINYSSQTTASCIDVPDANGIIGWIMFKNITLISAKYGDGATVGGTMAEGVTSAATRGYLYFDNQCSSFNATIFSQAHASILLASPVQAAATLGGLGKAAA